MPNSHASMSLRVLVVDDEPSVRMLVSYALTDAHMHVELAADGREGLSFLQTAQFDAVLVDLNLRDMSGEQLIARIRQSHPNLAVVMMTAEPEHKVPARRHVDAYLNKPFRLSALEAALTRAMSARQALHVG